jgi:hypothetical protein
MVSLGLSSLLLIITILYIIDIAEMIRGRERIK